MDADARARRDAFLGKIGSRAVIMGILNVTPDSFSDGGRFLARDAALVQARSMAAAGCDIIDVGGESTRPGAAPVPEAEELARIEPILADLAQALDIPVSIDTYKASVARRAAELGAVVINDVWGLQKDPEMAAAVAETETALVMMHNRSEKDAAVDILADIRQFFDRSLTLAQSAGIPAERMILDPGIGFGKTSAQSIETIGRLDRLAAFGLPLLVGASRKRFIDTLSPAPPDRRLGGSIAAHVMAVLNGAAIVRAHDVAETVQALKVVTAIREHA
jgi:dihydropteroate synthase